MDMLDHFPGHARVGRDAGSGEDESRRGAAGKRGSADRESGDLAGEAEGAKHGGDGRSLPPATDAQTGRAEKDSRQAPARMSVNNLPDT